MNIKTFDKIPYGLYVVTSHYEGKHNGCIINTLAQISLTPIIIAISINKQSLTHDMISKSKRFCVSILDENCDFETIKHFGFSSGKNTDKFIDFDDTITTTNGTFAITKHTNAYISANVIREFDLGSHTLFIAEIADSKILNELPSLTYDYYHKNIKPRAEKSDTSNQTIWRCKICAYEYVGENLPEDYVCPICKHPASDFEKI